jgi:hypothetical protein
MPGSFTTASNECLSYRHGFNDEDDGWHGRKVIGIDLSIKSPSGSARNKQFSLPDTAAHKLSCIHIFSSKNGRKRSGCNGYSRLTDKVQQSRDLGGPASLQL